MIKSPIEFEEVYNTIEDITSGKDLIRKFKNLMEAPNAMVAAATRQDNNIVFSFTVKTNYAITEDLEFKVKHAFRSAGWWITEMIVHYKDYNGMSISFCKCSVNRASDDSDPE